MDGKGCGLLVGGALFALVVVIFLVVAATGGAHTQTARATGGCFLSFGDGCNVTIYQEAAQPADFWTSPAWVIGLAVVIVGGLGFVVATRGMA